MDFNKLFQSKTFKGLLLGVFFFIILLLVFQAGMMVGFRKANFSYLWGENYHRNFAGPRGGFMDDMRGRDFIESAGIFGQIIKIDGQNIIIRGQDNVEKIILIQDDTVIRRFQDNLKLSDLKVDDSIVVIGEPNDAGQIAAKLIRIMPPMPKDFNLAPGIKMP
jgi:hypothetical protein